MINVLIAILSLVILIKSAEVFLKQSIILGSLLHINSYLIGATIVAFGTSLPELMVSTYSTSAGHTDIAISNILGSNIANLCMIFGILALYRNIKFTEEDARHELPRNFMLLLVFSCFILIFGFILNWYTGLVLLSIFLFVHFYNKRDELSESRVLGKFNPFLFLIGFSVLIYAGKVCVDSVLGIVSDFGISESLLGFFFIAVGTSIPELIVTFITLRKGEEEIGIGNILGSNFFNIFFVLGISSLIRPLDFSGFVFDLIFLIGANLLTILLVLSGKKYYLSRIEGVVLISYYLVFFVIQSFLLV